MWAFQGLFASPHDVSDACMQKNAHDIGEMICM
jgi:hypothetical protein